MQPNLVTVLSNDETKQFLRRPVIFFKKGHTVSFKNADDGVTHVLLYLGRTDREALK